MESVRDFHVTAQSQITAATRALAQALENEPYAFVGGAACQLLGSARMTQDVDIVVPRGAPSRILDILRQSPHFRMAPNRATSFVGAGAAADDMPGSAAAATAAAVAVDVLSPPARFAEPYDAQTPTLTVDGLRVLHPVLILNSKCYSAQVRVDDSKAFGDVLDIGFLLGYIHEHPQLATGPTLPVCRATVPRATPLFISCLVEEYPHLRQAWERVGYDFATRGRPNFTNVFFSSTSQCAAIDNIC